MKEQFKLYNEDGQVENPEVAKEMAEVENPYHDKKILGIFKNSREIEKGEKLGEIAGKQRISELNKEQELREISESVNSLEFFEKGIRFETNGHQLEILGEICEHRIPPRGRQVFKFEGISGKIDGNELSQNDLKKILNKFSEYIISKAGNEKIEEALNKKTLEQERQKKQQMLDLEKQKNEQNLELIRQKEEKRRQNERQDELSQNNRILVEDVLK